MTPHFHRLSIDEFAELLRRFSFTRTINAVHMHHTWRPNHAQFRGHDTIVSMWRFHTQENGWSDIAQHVTIDPEGMIWTGRNWNRPPASAAGQNGSAEFGPFMFEMIGDFDVGRDRFEGSQRDTTLEVIALVQERFGLSPESLVFHKSMSSKTCPGSAIGYDEVLAAVRALHEEGRLPRARAASAEDLPFPDSARASSGILQDLTADRPRGADPADAELDEERGALFPYTPAPTKAPLGRAVRAGDLTPTELADLRPYVINLRQGVFSDDGEMTSSSADVDAIFDEELTREADAAKERGEKLRVLFYAHGGLVSESSALRLAHQHVQWWRRNRVYPIYFIWETGLFETIGQLLDRTRSRARAAARDVFDHTTDRLVEATVRALGGATIWGGMKRSAERASGDEGGARYAAGKLAAFCNAHGDVVELHAVGHSAGAIFHAHFLPAALTAGAPEFAGLHLLAPAIRVDTFTRLLVPRMGSGVAHTTVFTMRKDLERADNCARVYRKSLLYLISKALEDKRNTPILGLEESLRDDRDLRALFGLGSPINNKGEVVWSQSVADHGRSASRSTTHGGFDNDAATMNSVARRVLGKNDTEPLEEDFPRDRARAAGDEWERAVDWPEGLELLDQARLPPIGGVVRGLRPAPAREAPPGGPGAARAGRRLALCVGIDDYADSPLSGCVADARMWADTLRRLGFEEPSLLLDRQATRAAILDALAELLTSSRTGDVVVFQFSGHGTQVPDVQGDEESGDTPGMDEAMCPHDMDSGALVIDDDLAEVLARTPAGVNATLFIDCCHSGTVSRLGIGSAARRLAPDERPRFIVAGPQLIAAHRRFRADMPAPRARHRGPETMREVLFSACLSSELAWESGGQGEFTIRATRELRNGIDNVTHEAFVERVRRAFGARPRQHPELDCAPARRKDPLLQPGSGGAAANGVGPPPADGDDGERLEKARIPDLLRQIADELD
jgi:hypothetical protein